MNKNYIFLLFSFLLLVSIFLYHQIIFRKPPPKVVAPVEPVRVEPVREVVVVREPQPPEYRQPPYKQYKPPNYQQMGLLTSEEDGSVIPLYGRESFGYRDRYNYYTTTTGNQVYSLPLTYQDRDCTEDMGCQEFYGNEVVNVLGKDYKTKMYRTNSYYVR
jgi:hypothetical protein